jgi:hypothetical protein
VAQPIGFVSAALLFPALEAAHKKRWAAPLGIRAAREDFQI